MYVYLFVLSLISNPTNRAIIWMAPCLALPGYYDDGLAVINDKRLKLQNFVGKITLQMTQLARKYVLNNVYYTH